MTLRIFAILAVLFAPDASAYIDPGSGSILIQGLIAAIAAIGVSCKLYWHRFTGLFRTSEPSVAKDDTENVHEPPEDSSPS